MIYIIVEYGLFDYGYVSKNKSVLNFRFFDEDVITIPMLVRAVLKKDGLGFKTLKEAKEYRKEKPVFGNVKFYDVRNKKEVR